MPIESGRMVVTISPPAAKAVRRMGSQMGDLGNVETVRRGLILLDTLLSLTDDEELTIRNKTTGVVERIRFSWGAFD